ncbi:MAG: hypothetical protein ACMXYE_02750 [Candidatus Woesearchaeota archaeon]
MKSTIIPHAIVPLSQGRDIPSLQKDGFIITKIKAGYIAGKEIQAPYEISSEGVDALSEEVNEVYDELVEKGFDPHVLVRESARARLENENPAGYIAEISNQGIRMYAVQHMSHIPILAGYGSLMDPAQLAANTASGDLRNSASPEELKQLAEERNITEKLSYAAIADLELRFNRTATARRHGATQEERNNWTVLNVYPKQGTHAYVVLFDPEQVTDNPLSYFARENFDEIEYARRSIDPRMVSHIGGAPLPLHKKIWVLDSPLITDVVDGNDDSLKPIMPHEKSEIKDSYMEMVTNGLAGAYRISSEFPHLYTAHAKRANGKSLHTHERFMECLEEKLC